MTPPTPTQAGGYVPFLVTNPPILCHLSHNLGSRVVVLVCMVAAVGATPRLWGATGMDPPLSWVIPLRTGPGSLGTPSVGDKPPSVGHKPCSQPVPGGTGRGGGCRVHGPCSTILFGEVVQGQLVPILVPVPVLTCPPWGSQPALGTMIPGNNRPNEDGNGL